MHASTLALALTLLVPHLGRAEATHRAELRVAHIKGALEAVRHFPPETLAHAHEYARVIARGACSSSVQRLKVECLMTGARRFCRKKGSTEAQACQASMDVVVSNVLGESQFISSEKRYQLMTQSKDYRSALTHELRRLQGALAVDFRLRMGEAEEAEPLAKNIDHYCLATADETNLAWQTCVSSLVWFIGGGAATQPSRSEP